MVPYFKAGLENNEFCMWVTSELLSIEDAKKALKGSVEDLDEYIKKGQIEIIDHSQWYTKSGRFEADKVLQGWVEKEKQALKRGFEGLRLTGNTFWLEKRDWKNFNDYEAMVDSVIGKYKIIAICTYSLDKCGASEIIDVINNHQFVLLRREGRWESIESSQHKKAVEDLLYEQNLIQALFARHPDFIYFKDGKARFIRVNDRFCDFFKCCKEDILGKTDLDLFPKEVAKQTFNEDIQIIKTGKPIINKEESATGTWVLTTKMPWFNKEGNIIGLFGISRDITERKKAEEKLEEQKLSLEQKNLALKEMVEHIERTKNKTKEDIAVNVDEVLLPILKKLKIKGASAKYVNLLQHHLGELTSSFGHKITQKSTKLTPREIEICNMMKGGLSSKDLSKLLNVSHQTIEKHRKNIRKKLGISNKKANLVSYLRQI